MNTVEEIHERIKNVRELGLSTDEIKDASDVAISMSTMLRTTNRSHAFKQAVAYLLLSLYADEPVVLEKGTR